MAENQPGLRRVLTFWPLLLNGLGVIVGAGIYVAIGSVIGRAGDSAPVAFLLAGITAAMTGLCYAELVSRFPEAAGSVAYVRHGFGSDTLARLTGIALTTVVAVSAASIAQGAVTYLTILLPWPAALLLPLLIIACAAIAAYGIGESVGIAAAIGVLEIAGLIAASVVGLIWAPVLHLPAILPADLPAWESTLSGAFIAFFAYIGFETLANLAEETKDPDRTVPRGILGAIVISIVLYVTVATAAVLSGTSSQRPLLDIFPGGSAWLFAWVGFLAVANGVLVQIVMLARLFYGMANRSQIPRVFAHVSARTATPLRATALATAIVMVAAILVPFEQLLVLNNAVTLGIFILVDIALWRVQRAAAPRATGFTVPRWVPPIAALLAGALLLAEVVAIAFEPMPVDVEATPSYPGMTGEEDAMLDTVEALLRDMLTWLDRQPRTYEEVMDAWRTSCPRLPVWEEANDRGLVEQIRVDRQPIVRLTPAGRQLLASWAQTATIPGA